MLKKKTKSKKGLKKSFYDVEAPTTAVKIQLYGTSAEDLDGRIVKLDLTKSLRGKSLELKMMVREEEGKLKAEPVSAKLVPSHIRRNMRRGADYVEDSFEVECKDVIARAKIFLISRRRISRAVRKALRDAGRKFVEGYTKIRSSEELFSEIMSSKLQKTMALKLKKIYPLALCEIRVFEVLRERGKVVKEEKKVEIVEKVVNVKEEKEEIKEGKVEKVEKVKVEIKSKEEKVDEADTKEKETEGKEK
jgi:ribosomal protein S3AE